MTFDEFITQRTNKPVDFDGIYPNQCMDLMHQYIYDVLGLTDKYIFAAPYAYQVYTNSANVAGWDKFTKVANTPTGVPPKGAIMFMDKNVAGVTGVAGHVCMFVSGDTNKFKSFDANYPTGTLPHIQEHTYAGVLGWAVFKGVAGEPQVCDPKSVRDILVAKAGQRDEVCNYLGLPLDPKQTDASKITSTIGGYKSRITDLTTQLTTATAEVGNREEQVSRLKTQVLEGSTRENSLIEQLKKAGQGSAESMGVLQGQVADKQKVIDGLSKDKGKLNQQIAVLQNQLAEAKKGLTKSLTVTDILDILVKKLSGKEVKN